MKNLRRFRWEWSSIEPEIDMKGTNNDGDTQSTTQSGFSIVNMDQDRHFASLPQYHNRNSFEWNHYENFFKFNGFTEVPFGQTDTSPVELYLDFFDHLPQHRSELKRKLEEDNFSIFAAYGWNGLEEELFFKGLARYTRLFPELIAKRIETKNTLQVKIMLKLLENLSSICPIKISRKKHLQAQVQSPDDLRKEIKRADKRVASEQRGSFNQDIPFDFELFNHEGWILLSKTMIQHQDASITGSFYVQLKVALSEWLKMAIHKIRLFARERQRTFRRESKYVDIITKNDVECFLEREKLTDKKCESGN